MQAHVKSYMHHNNFDVSDFIPCEAPNCGQRAVDIHHLVKRSKFGKKTKHLQDAPSNLIALCRCCHDKAESSREFNELLITKNQEKYRV